ncbi:hypothetical protein NDU88_006126 [Pleurodeles waltl]|uniref:Uncharacterized protein n=1 Tax=Pleurodeles waltl TaxID=8319 RepID=A0AAV7UK44_PLEWA|nr:hypothetical protein NDU88_006126 [Pleurodeles waltl]
MHYERFVKPINETPNFKTVESVIKIRCMVMFSASCMLWFAELRDITDYSGAHFSRELLQTILPEKNQELIKYFIKDECASLESQMPGKSVNEHLGYLRALAITYDEFVRDIKSDLEIKNSRETLEHERT